MRTTAPRQRKLTRVWASLAAGVLAASGLLMMTPSVQAQAWEPTKPIQFVPAQAAGPIRWRASSKA
jgi:hypothetical protein